MSVAIPAVDSRPVVNDYVIVVSAISLVITGVALAILVYVAQPIGHTSLYFTYTAVGLSLAALVVSSCVKFYRACIEEPPGLFDRYTYQEYQEQFGAHWDDITIPDPIQNGPIAIEPIKWPIKTSPHVIVHGSKSNRDVVIFEQAAFPGLIFKKMPIDQARQQHENMQTCATTSRDNGLVHCKVPHSELIVLENQPGFGIVVIEKFQNFPHPLLAQETCERLSERFVKDVQLKEKWIEYFRQAAVFVHLAGYNKINWSDMLLLEDGIAFIDFRYCFPQKPGEDLSTSQMARASYTLAQLKLLAPPECENVIQQTADLYGVTIEKKEEEEAQKQTRLALHKEIRLWHAQQGIIDTSPIAWETGETEKTIDRIVQRINQDLVSKSLNSDLTGCLIAQRKVRYISFSLNPKEEELAFEELKNLKVIHSWDKTPLAATKFYSYFLYC